MACNPYPLDQAEFRAYLQEQAACVEVGYACDDGECPLARFLRTQYPDSMFLVSLIDYRRVMDDISLGLEPDAVFPLPAWAQDFVWMVDGYATFDEEVPITAGEALMLLAAVGCREGVFQEVNYAV